MKIEAKVYRLNSGNLSIKKILEYNFFDYEDTGSSPTFWRNAFKIVQQQQTNKRDLYIDHYVTALNSMIEMVKNTEDFFIEEEDISGQIEGYTINKQLNVVYKVQNVVFKQTSTFKIRDNDLVVIKEDNQVVMIGFVVSIGEELKYGEYPSRDVSIGDIGYLYNITHTIADRAVADYAIAGIDTMDLEEPVFSDNYNNLNTFQIVERIVKNYMFGTKVNDETSNNTIKYLFDSEAFEKSFAQSTKQKPASFAMIFVFLRLLEKYTKYAGFLDFEWVKIEHGEHKVYNAMITSNFELFRPSFKTAAAVFDDVIKSGMYDFFIDLNGTMVIRPPLYNYYGKLPEDNAQDSALILMDDEYVLNPACSHFISEEEILESKLTFDNGEIKTRTDAQFVWPYVGEINWKPTCYIDIKGLVKYGFRNAEPYTNPNATTSELATLLAAMHNIIENSITRKLEIQVKTQDVNRFKIGEMYYIEKFIEGAINSKGKQTGTFGYLIDVSRSVEYEKYPLTTLTFSFLRTMEMVEPTETNKVDLINIYSRYGVFQKINTTELTSAQYKEKSKQQLDAFWGKIQNKKLIPAFKVFPSILDFITITYEDSQIVQKMKEKETQTQIKETQITSLNSDGTTYKSFLVKMQRFFKIENTKGPNEIISTLGNPHFPEFTKIGEIFKQTNKYTKDTYKLYPQKTINHHGFLYKLYKDIGVNLNIWGMNTGYDPSMVGTIKQNLFNRIVECDAEFKSIFSSTLQQYNQGAIPNTIYMYNSQINNFPINTTTYENNFFKITSTDFSTLFSHRYKIISIQNPVTSSSIIRFDLSQNGPYIIHPQCTMTMDMLLMNILASKTKTADAQAIDNKTGKTSQNLLKAHQDGRAIDITVPARANNNGKAQFLFMFRELMPLSNGNVVKTSIQYKQDFYDTLENTLIKHFDIVKRIPNVEFDISHLNLVDFGGTLITKYYADVYHLEVKEEDYQNIVKELLKSGNASSSVI